MSRLRPAAVLLLAGAAALLASGFLFGSTPDEEEYRYAVLSTQLHAQALLHGSYLTWTSQLGLGMPQPLGPSFLFHPLMPLLGVLPADLWVALLLTTHLVLGAAGAWQLGRTLGLSPMGRALFGATLLLATPTQNYLLTDFWPTLFVTWTTIPWLILGFLRLLEQPTDPLKFVHAAATGLLGGLIVANGHPGYLIVYGPALATFLAWHWRAVWRDGRAWLLLLTVGVTVAAPTLYHLSNEFLNFPAGLPRDNYGSPLTTADLPGVFLRPFSASFEYSLDETRVLGTRKMFFGGPFALLALIGTATAVRGRARRDLAIAAAASLALMMMPELNRIPFFTATYLFRDPMILFAAPLAALVLDSLLAHRLVRSAAMVFGGVQVMVLVLAAWPFLQDTWATREWPYTPARSIARGTTFSSSISAAIAQEPGRLYLSSGVNGFVTANSTRRDGLVANSFAYLGVPVVNGRFKGVSADPIYASATVPYGAILSPESVQHASSMLDLAGIRWVLALDGESLSPGLERHSAVTDSLGRAFILWRNPTALPGVVVVDDAARRLDLSRRAGCSIRGFLCADVDELHSLIRSGVSSVRRDHGRIVIELEPAESPRLLLVSEMFRPEWKSAPAASTVTAAFGGLMFVDVQPGTRVVTLAYRPRTRLVLSGIAWATFVAVTTAWLLSRAPRRNQ